MFVRIFQSEKFITQKSQDIFGTQDKLYVKW